MFVIKMWRIGRANRPFFRIIASDKKGKLNAKTKYLGFICPLKKDFWIDLPKVKELISNGAKISKNLFFRMKSINDQNTESKNQNNLDLNEILNKSNIC